MKLTRRLFTAAAALAGGIALAGCGGADSGARTDFEREGDFAKGSPDAPVTMIEYASTACGGCAAFHEQVMPTLETHIRSGDLRFVMREMITGQPNLAIAGFMLARCAPEERYFSLIDTLFEQQRALMLAMQQGQAQSQFQSIARAAGFSDAQFQDCMTNEDVLAQVQAANQRAIADGINATPTFIVNGSRLETERAPDGSGMVYAVNGRILEDEQGPIPALFEGDSFERIILYFKARAE